MNRIIFVCLGFLMAGIADATTWAPAEKTDPLTGEKVPAHEIMSYGSYIYNWPSKYDLVFWPFIDQNWICLNARNGYGAFNDDFEKVPDEEKKDLAKWLAENYKPSQSPGSHHEKLAWLEKVYGQRKMDDDFWCRFYRLMAYVHREDAKKSLDYVKRAMPLLKKKLQGNPEGISKLEVLFLLGEYHRRLGEQKQAKEYFAQVKTVKYKDKEGQEQVGHPYFIELVQQREKPAEKEPPDRTDEGKGK